MKKITIDDIEIPAQMLKELELWGMQNEHTCLNGGLRPSYLKLARFVLFMIAENPIVPSEEEAFEVFRSFNDFEQTMAQARVQVLTEWQRLMFLRRAPEVPEEVKELFWSAQFYLNIHHNDAVLKAYELGKKATGK